MGLTDIQQAFVRRYMDDDERVLGVRVRVIAGQPTILVDVDGHAHADLPSEFHGVPIQVREGHRAVLAYRQKADLLKPGCWVFVDPISTYGDHRHTRRGSFGLLVEDLAPEQGDDDRRLILTAAHLLEGHPGDAKLSFARPGIGPGVGHSQPCGVLRRRVPLSRVPTIAVDAAVIKPPKHLACGNETGGGTIRAIRDLWLADEETEIAVSKVGARTRATTGRLMPVAADNRVRDMRVRYSQGWWVYGDSSDFAAPGDSGAIVVDEDRNAVGMLVAIEHDGPKAAAYVHGIKQIFRALEIAMPSARR